MEAGYGLAKPHTVWSHVFVRWAHPRVLQLCALLTSPAAAQPKTGLAAEQGLPARSSGFRSCKNWQCLENTAPVAAGERQECCRSGAKN